MHSNYHEHGTENIKQKTLPVNRDCSPRAHPRYTRAPVPRLGVFTG